MEYIGHQLKYARERQNIDIEKLAQLVGVNEETIMAIEEGKLDTQVSILYKLSDILKVSFKIGDMSI